MSSRAAVSSEITIAKKMTVTAMYQEVAIQFGHWAGRTPRPR